MTTIIDSDFVLNSKSTRLNERSIPLTNSQLTMTTRDLTYNALRDYSPGRYQDSAYRRSVSPDRGRELRRSMSPAELKRTLRESFPTRSRSPSPKFSANNNRMSRQRSRSASPTRSILRGSSPNPDIDQSSMRKSVTYDSRLEHSDLPRRRGSFSDTDSELELLERRMEDERFREKLYRQSSKLATWSTHPMHLTEQVSPEELRNSIRRGRNVGSHSPRLYEEFPNVAVEHLAKQFFPYTMSAYRINHIEPPMSRSMATSPPPKHLRAKSPHKWRVDGKVNHLRGRHTPKQETSSRADAINKMHNLIDVAPSIAASTIHMVSPYAGDLASLRLERLRIEEDHLLEMKRLAELERIRGPQSKWYELKTPDFHYEAHKNNELIKNSGHWQDLMDRTKDAKTH